MTAPTQTSRTLPTGFVLKEGFKTTIAFASAPGVAFWEKSVKPFGWDTGDFIDTTTQHNVEYYTKAAPKLKECTEISGTAAYDPDAKDAIKGLVGKEQAITTWNPDNSSDAFFGALRKVEFTEMKVKEQPMLNYTVEVTNYDPIGKVEAGPVHFPSAGT